jgi:transposase
VPLLLSVPGIGWVLAYTIAAEIGDITRFASAKKLCGYTGLCPRVAAAVAITGLMHGYQRTKRRLGRRRGAKVAQIDIAGTLTEAMWHMLTTHQPFTPAPGGSTFRLAA